MSDHVETDAERLAREATARNAENERQRLAAVAKESEGRAAPQPAANAAEAQRAADQRAERMRLLGAQRDPTLGPDGMRLPNSPDRPGDPVRDAAHMPNRAEVAPMAPIVANLPAVPAWDVKFQAGSVSEAAATLGHPDLAKMNENARNAVLHLLHAMSNDGPVEVEASSDGADNHMISVKHIAAP